MQGSIWCHEPPCMCQHLYTANMMKSRVETCSGQTQRSPGLSTFRGQPLTTWPGENSTVNPSIKRLPACLPATQHTQRQILCQISTFLWTDKISFAILKTQVVLTATTNFILEHITLTAGALAKFYIPDGCASPKSLSLSLSQTHAHTYIIKYGIEKLKSRYYFS